MASLALLHRFNLFFESPRGTGRAELAGESISTGIASAFAIAGPGMLPIKQLLLTFAPETSSPIQITLLAVVTLLQAKTPKAVLPLPVVLFSSAKAPLAMLSAPVVLLASALKPLAVLSLPTVLLKSASAPLAVLKLPAVCTSAAQPTPVLFRPPWL